jgi:hypothetical protein
MSVTVYGASDDLIEVVGDIREEFPWHAADGTAFLGFSNGVVLRVAFSISGVWRIVPVAGTDLVQVTQCPEGDEDNYSDRATVSGDVAWVVCGSSWAGGLR